MYHISHTPNLTELEPRVPHLAGLEEPLTPRVCAAPTIPGCLYGLVELEDNTNYHVYEIAGLPDITNEAIVNWPGPFSVIDADISGEVWYTQPVPCNYLGPLEDLCDPTDELN